MHETLRTSLWAAVVGLGLLACDPDAPSQPPTMIVLIPVFDDAWQLTQLELTSEEHYARWPEPARSLRSGEPIHVVLTSSSEYGRPMLISAWGLAGETRVARGEVEVVPRGNETVQATLELSKLPCGDWCTPGTFTCAGDALRECVEEPGGCTAWGPAVDCPEETPYCSLGRCDKACVDECASGTSRCLGPGAAQSCGLSDSDPCLDWGAAVPCPEGEVCDRGTCIDPGLCHDDCAVDEVRCEGGAVVACGHHDGDDCLDWGPAIDCPPDQSCNSGTCAPLDQCTDECTSNACEGNEEHRTCGQFDLDTCSDWGPVTSCIPSDACFEPACDPDDGCSSTRRACDTPPPSMCADSGSLQVFDPSGICENGYCTYGSKLVPCPNCPNCDPCAGVVCDQKAPCYQGIGTCHEGHCEYAFADGESCNDGDACTTGDRCETGACGGTPLSCDQPEPPECVGPGLLRTFESPGTCQSGQCHYDAVEQPCPNGCSGGACICADTDETVTSADAARHTSVFVGPDHRVHVSYLSDSAGSIHVAHRALDGSWTVEFAAAQGVDGTSLVVDEAGTQYLAYANGSRRLAVARRAVSGTWQTEVVDSSTGQSCPSLAVDAAGGLHVIYGNTGGWLSYARRPSGGSWSVESYVTSDGEEMTDASVIVDDQGAVHVSYVAYHEPPMGLDDHSVHYGVKTGSDWSFRELGGDPVAGHGTSLVPRPGGGALIAYRDASLGLRIWEVGATGTVKNKAAGPTGSLQNGRFVRLARDPQGLLRLVYAAGPQVWQMRSTDALGDSWAWPAVIGQVGEATGCSLFVDAEGAAHVGFQDANSGSVAYVRRCP